MCRTRLGSWNCAVKPNTKLQLLKQQSVAVNLTCAGTYSVITQMYCTGKNTVTALSTQPCPVKWLHVKGLQRLFLVRSPDLEEGGVGGIGEGLLLCVRPKAMWSFWLDCMAERGEG